MLESVVIIGAVMACMELIKKHTRFPKEAYFIPILVLSGGFNAANAYFFGGVTNVAPYVAEGLKLGAMAGGIYGLGKAALGKS